MASYVMLVNWTEQGIQAYRDTLDRSETTRQLAEKLGASVKELYWTLGAYDVVGIVEAPDDETMTAVALALSSQGNVRTTTMRAFGPDEMRQIVAKATG